MQKEKLDQFLGQVVCDLAAASSGVIVRIGHRLGFYRALAGSGALTPGELARKTGTLERYALEWLNHQRVSGYVDFEPATGKYSLSEEHAMVLAAEDSPAFIIPAFDVASSFWHDEDLLVEAFRHGRGVHWGDHHPRLFCGVESFFRKSYENYLTSEWIPALDGVHAALVVGSKVADVGCGHGASTILMAKAYPNSRFIGFDLHDESIRVARERAKEHGVADRVRFEVAPASGYPGSNYDFVCFMDAFHDMGDPIGAARHTRAALAHGGTLMLVEPFAEAHSEQNEGPVARQYYAASVACCVPNAIAQSGTVALGAQAGPKRLEEALRAGGFNNVRVAVTSPFNLVMEARA
jgi:SAM-dependent methyltransferase